MERLDKSFGKERLTVIKKYRCYKGNISIYIDLYFVADSICFFSVVDAGVLIAPFNGM